MIKIRTQSGAMFMAQYISIFQAGNKGRAQVVTKIKAQIITRIRTQSLWPGLGFSLWSRLGFHLKQRFIASLWLEPGYTVVRIMAQVVICQCNS